MNERKTGYDSMMVVNFNHSPSVEAFITRTCFTLYVFEFIRTGEVLKVQRGGEEDV